jgi:hypothetical protein
MTLKLRIPFAARKTSRSSEKKVVSRAYAEVIKMPRAGFEPATTRSSAERSPRLSYLGGVGYLFMMS